MTGSLLGLLVIALVGAVTLGYWAVSARTHQRRLDALDLRVHVNGIRGKSTVTRLLAGVLREGGYHVLAKTTGSAARVIAPDGSETPIHRRGAATINEQVDIVRRHVAGDVDALVMECMAVRPLYQQYAQDYLVRSHVTVITNVRLDHQEEMGETLEEIADSLSVTIPRGGVLITAEDRPHLVERLRRNAHARGARLVLADPATVSDADMHGFDYLQFKENVAIGLALAELAGIPRDRALAGMWAAVPDIGALRLKTYHVRDKVITWVPMFAANDRESVVQQLHRLTPLFPTDATVIALLNNRQDRGRRAELFAEMVPHEIGPLVDEVVTLGAFENVVTERIVAGGYPSARVHNLGDTVRPDLEGLLDGLLRLIPGDEGVLIGMVNIHTSQAELLIDYFEELDGIDRIDELALSRDPRRTALPLARVTQARRLAALRLGASEGTEVA